MAADYDMYFFAILLLAKFDFCKLRLFIKI